MIGELALGAKEREGFVYKLGYKWRSLEWRAPVPRSTSSHGVELVVGPQGVHVTRRYAVAHAVEASDGADVPDVVEREAMARRAAKSSSLTSAERSATFMA